MKTIYASLPFYDSTDKQEFNRYGGFPIDSPRHQLPPFLINAQSDTIATVDEVLLVDCDGDTTDITAYFETLPFPVTVGSDTYLQYAGDLLKTELPKGMYYLQISNDDVVYYSEYIRISDIYPNLITGVTNAPVDGYDTLTLSRTAITSAITDGSAVATAYSNVFSAKMNIPITVQFYYTLNSGAAATIYLQDFSYGVGSNVVNLSDGLNTITFTPLYSSTAMRVVIQNSAAASNWEASAIFAYNTYAPNFTHLAFSNSKDLGDILYSTGFEQDVWLETGINTPEGEVVEVGEEKDGVFLTEKIVTKYIYRIIAYVTRAMYRCLIRLPQHDSITITDEVGNSYTPSVGNVQVTGEPAAHETMKVTIRFNDGDNSAFGWTYDMSNLI